MDQDLAALQVAIEMASPGTPSLTCRRIAEVVEDRIREAKADAWDEGHRTPVKYGPDNCHCSAYNESECACGCFNSNVITPNPYRD